MKHIATIHGLNVDADGNPTAENVIFHAGPAQTMLFTGKRLVGPFDEEELEFLRVSIAKNEPPATLTITDVDYEKRTVTLSSHDRPAQNIGDPEGREQPQDQHHDHDDVQDALDPGLQRDVVVHEIHYKAHENDHDNQGE